VNVVGSDRWCRNSEVTVRTDYLQTLASELLRAMRSHQESYVSPGTQEAAAEVSSHSACPNHQDAHVVPQSLMDLKPFLPSNRLLGGWCSGSPAQR
jgi:hypothetical protein